MKSVILFRHGQAGWGNSIFGKDYDKPLTPIGEEEAYKMGVYLSELNYIPDLIISSTANRAKTTMKLAYKSGNWKSIVKFETKIYGGKPNFLLELINKQNNKHNSICLVGHEPNFSSFILLTTGIYKIFNTASMAKIDFKTNQWQNISDNKGYLDWLINPTELI